MIKAKYPLFTTKDNEAPQAVQMAVWKYLNRNSFNLVPVESWKVVKSTSHFTDHLIYKVEAKGNWFVFLTDKQNRILSQSAQWTEKQNQKVYFSLAEKIEKELIAKGRL
jgi:hypothetical protein